MLSLFPSDGLPDLIPMTPQCSSTSGPAHLAQKAICGVYVAGNVDTDGDTSRSEGGVKRRMPHNLSSRRHKALTPHQM